VSSYDSRFERELKKRISEELDRLGEILESGQAIKDYAEYKNYVGQIAAFKRVAHDFCLEVQTIIDKG
jgi:hypothetical protein